MVYIDIILLMVFWFCGTITFAYVTDAIRNEVHQRRLAAQHRERRNESA